MQFSSIECFVPEQIEAKTEPYTDQTLIERLSQKIAEEKISAVNSISM